MVETFNRKVFEGAHNFYMRIYVNLMVEEFEEAGFADFYPVVRCFLSDVVVCHLEYIPPV